MNKYVIIFGVIAAMLFSCTRETAIVDDIQPEQTITFTAGWADSEETKTILQSDGKSVWWDAAEQINVFFSDLASGRFTSRNAQPQAIVDFQGSLPIVVGSIETDNPAHAYWAVYPYNAANTCDGESVTITVPSVQTTQEESFANKMFPSIATSTNFHLAFYNVCGGARFTVANEGITSITFKANNGESLAGKVQVGFDGTPVVKDILEGSSEVLVNAPEGGFIPGMYYFVSLLPETLTKGLSLTFKKSDSKVAFTSLDYSITINRSRFGRVEEKDKGLEFMDDGSGHNPNDNIVFADILAKYACVERFDSNGDGEVSYEEAAAATSLSGLFRDWKEVSSFDEIKYFTGVTSTEGLFENLSKLTAITIPDNITTIGKFESCNALAKVVMPKRTNPLPSYLFLNCGSIQEVVFPENIETIPEYCIAGMNQLKKIQLPNSLRTIGKEAFSVCYLLQSVEFPNSLSRIEQKAFYGCKSLDGAIVFPSNVSYIGTDAFSYCASITDAIFLSSVTIDHNAFKECTGLTNVLIPAYSRIESGAFSKCTSLINLQISEGVSIGVQAFQECISLEYLSLPEGVSIGQYAFAYCSSLSRIVLPPDLTVLQAGAFDDCQSLYAIEWPVALKTIEGYAFRGCSFIYPDAVPNTSNSRIVLPETVVEIGDYAFYGVWNIAFPSKSLVSIGSISFYYSASLYVPDNLMEFYRLRTNWTSYKHLYSLNDYPKSLDISEPHFVDLGLPSGTKWATTNIGAETLEKPGYYFAWGELSPNKIKYEWQNYRWCNGSVTGLTKYNDNADYGVVDNRSELEDEDDIVFTVTGGQGHIPTLDNWKELSDASYCSWEWTSVNGVEGYLVTSLIDGYTDRSIFLPVTGYFHDIKTYETYNGHYWTSELAKNTLAYSVELTSAKHGFDKTSKSFGLAIRPVRR